MRVARMDLHEVGAFGPVVIVSTLETIKISLTSTAVAHLALPLGRGDSGARSNASDKGAEKFGS
jgi:hypothetical protein